MATDAEIERWRAFGTWLRERRHAAGLTQAQLAARTGLSVTAIQHYEAGVRTERGQPVVPNPTERTLVRLADGLQVGRGELADRAGAELGEAARSGAEPPAASEGELLALVEDMLARHRSEERELLAYIRGVLGGE